MSESGDSGFGMSGYAPEMTPVPEVTEGQNGEYFVLLESHGQFSSVLTIPL